MIAREQSFTAWQQNLHSSATSAQRRAGISCTLLLT